MPCLFSMYHGHFALGLLMKALGGSSLPAAPVIFGSGLLDIAGGIEILLGARGINPTSDIHASSYMYTRFDWIDATHSLLTSTLLAVIFAASLYYFQGANARAAVLGCAASVGHWLFDSIVIHRKLALYPWSSYHFGYGLYTHYPYGSWVFECALCAVFGLIAQRVSRKNGAEIGSVLWILAFQALSFNPWTSPPHLLVKLNPPYHKQILGLAFIAGYAVPCYIYTRLLDAADAKAKTRIMKGM